jgi:glycosyltransferase involved in cell wall biosynthesis
MKYQHQRNQRVSDTGYSTRVSPSAGRRVMSRVLMIEAEMKRYRAPFYGGLHAALQSDGIQLQVAYSEPRSVERSKQDQCNLPDEYGTKVTGYWLFNKLLLQPLLHQAALADLIILDEGNRYLLSHLLLPFSACRLKKVAWWGLGENKQTDRLVFSEWYKTKILRWITWWFAYTSSTVEYLVRHGFPRDRITVVQNAVDTREMNEWIVRFTEAEAGAVRLEMGIPPSAPVGVYCGGLDKVKNIPFLIESAKLVKERIHNFHLVIIGGGKEMPYVEEQAALNREWLHSVGPRFGRDKALVLKMADVCMMPGRVGLAILDAFAAGLPLFTTKIPIHGPEVEYLVDGRNGLITESNPQLYAEVVSAVLSTPPWLAQLKEGAKESCQKYSIEAMVANFHRGIRDCLGRN